MRTDLDKKASVEKRGGTAGPPLPGGKDFPAPILLPSIRGPEDVRRLSEDQLPALAEEIRHVLTTVVAHNGGHLSSNLGITELTIALHRVFDFSWDRLMFDVGHQVYVHKLLTGRYPQFHTLRQWNGLAGFPNPAESPFDLFMTAHASSAISTSLGLAVANQTVDERRRRVVAVIGDGAMTGGVAFEGLNQAGHLKRDLIVILNDNEMAISPTVGALQKYLSRVRTGAIYNEVRNELRRLIGNIPLVGDQIDRILDKVLSSVKEFLQPGQIFRELGFRYFGPIDGHDLELLMSTLRGIKQLEGPILLHVLTRKGQGLSYATEDPEKFHSPAGFHAPARQTEEATTPAAGKSYSKVFVESLIEQAQEDSRIVAITAAMPSGTGLAAFQEKFPNRYYDVGICEQHAMAFAGGLARGGAKPVAAIYSTFLQRAYDQVFQELCLQGDQGVVIGVDRGGLVGGDGATTHGVFDIAFLRVLPNLVHLSPKDGPELQRMLRWAIAADRVVALRYPRDTAVELELQGENETEIELGRGEILREGEGAAILVYGPHASRCVEAARILERDHGIHATIANARFAKPVDHALASRLLETHRVVATVEDHALIGGFGSAVLEAVAERGAPVQRLLRIGIPDRFIPHGSRDDCLRTAGLDPASIARAVAERLTRKAPS